MIISVSGKMRSGKDTVADILVAKFGFVKLQWGMLVHEALLAQDPIIAFSGAKVIRYGDVIREVGYDAAKDRYPEVRTQLQNLGTEVGRNMFGPEVWVDLMRRKIHDLFLDKDIVVTGTRFQNELDMLHAFGARSVWVERPGPVIAASSHASENSITADVCHFYIDNSGPIKDLRESVVDLHYMIKEGFGDE